MNDAIVLWPCCRPLEPPRVGTGLFIDDELARAIRNEVAMAVAYWWAVHRIKVRYSRKALVVNLKNNLDTHHLFLCNIQGCLPPTIMALIAFVTPLLSTSSPCPVG
jgi:hypothetical protein